MGTGKSVLPAVLSGLFAAPAVAVDFQVDERSLLSIYGEFHYLYLFDERRLDDPDESLDAAIPVVSGDERVRGLGELVDNDSLLGISGERDLSAGNRLFFLAEWEFSADQPDGGLDRAGDAYVGVGGDWGELRIGQWDGIYDEWIVEAIDGFEYEGPSDFLDAGSGDLIAYFSPEIEGFSLAAQVAVKPRGAGLDVDDDDLADSVYPLSVTAAYAADDWELRFGLDDRAALGARPDPQYALVALFDPGVLGVGVKYERVGDSDTSVDDGLTALGVLLAYEYGHGTVALAGQRIDHDQEVTVARKDRTEWLVHANYRFDEQFIVYLEAARYERFQDADDYLAMGVFVGF